MAQPYDYDYLAPLSVSEKLWRVNWLVIAIIAVLGGIGVVALFSVAGGSLQPWAEQHALRMLFGVALILVVAATPIRFWLAIAYPVYLVALALLVAVFLFGTLRMGAQRWIEIGPLSFQPSEMMKVALVAALARYYQWLPPHRVSNPIWLLPPLIMIALPAAFVLKQPDLGTAVLFIVVGLSILFLAGVNLLYFAAGAAAVAALVPVVLANLHDYQRRRLMTFWEPDRDPLGAGYHIAQSKIALGSGGITGKGFMKGTQSQLNFLPEKHTDFIFPMLGEEMGFIGTMMLLVLYGLLFFVLLTMGLRCRNQFSRLLIGGSSVVVFVYLFINVAMVTGLVPVVGVPLPLVSYGGTSMITIMFALGLAQCGYVHRREMLRRSDMGTIC
ncbi:MAG: rod shape-determining protein RodA [Pseudomonadota bacterium]